MLQDLHSHTYYSFCGKDNPEDLIKNAIDAGLDVFGITDHNYGVGYGRYVLWINSEGFTDDDYGYNINKYFDHLTLLKEKYFDKIDIKRGIEVALYQYSMPNNLPKDADISCFDYAMIEHIDYPAEQNAANRDLFAYAKRCGTPFVGVAHTDLFAFIKDIGREPLEYFTEMAENNIFWEMNVNYDKVHYYREHQYVKDFFASEEQQEIIKKSGVRLSVGFDGHWKEDYKPERVIDACRKISEMGIKLQFE